MEYWEEIKKLKATHRGMVCRCTNPKNAAYKYYGSKGINVCNKWKKVEVFIKWAFINGWQSELQIDRKNNRLGYSPENCRFVTSKINNQNQSKSKLWHIEDKIFNSSVEAAKYFNTNSGKIKQWCDGQTVNGNYYPPKQNCWSEKLYP